MKKILLAFDGTNYSEGAFEFARRLNELQPILLTGVFLPLAQLSNLWSYAADGVGAVFIPEVEDTDIKIVEKNIARFENHCQQNGIEYRVHKDFNDMALPELKKESIYADLLILGSEKFFEAMGTISPNDYLQDLLHEVKCAVLLVPEKFNFPESIIMAYDGSDDSVFAIKQFTYIFPELCDKEVLLVYAHEDPEVDFPEKVQIEDLAARHFSNLTLCKLDIDPKTFFKSWVLEKKSSMLVSGSYKRSGLSQFFKRSFVRDIIAQHELPIFITHH